MQRSFLNRTIICLIPTLIATLLVVRAYLKDPDHLSGFKRGIDLSGGTILVYEVDQELSKLSRGSDAGTGRAVSDSALAESLKRRIDPADLLGVVVRPSAGGTRVEIVLPYGARGGEGGTGLNVSEDEHIKGLIREVGILEFRIRANEIDDEKAIADATAFFERAARDPESPEAKALDEAARAGLPPPFPNPDPTSPEGYIVMNEPVQYAWVELGKNQRAEYGLSSTNPGPGRHEYLSPNFEQARSGKGIVRHGRNAYWSRESKSEKNPGESAVKKFDYFVLTRLSEKDQVRVGGDVSITAYVSQGKTSEPVIGFTFNARGAEKFYQMTYRNRPSGPEGTPTVYRQLGIVLDG